MSATRHGLFSRGFLLCDRCAFNGYCEGFRAKGTCPIEEEAFSRLVEELTREYALDGVADRLLAERIAMTLIKIARGEAYGAAVGVSEEAALIGGYVERLDRMLLRLLEALAVTRESRKDQEGGDNLKVGVTELLKGLERKSKRAKPRKIRITVEEMQRWVEVNEHDIYSEILEDWLRDLEGLKEGERAVGG